MKKYSGIIMVGLLALLIGLIVSVQVNTTQGSDPGGLIPLAKAQGLEAELKKVRAEKEAATQRLIELEGLMEDIQKKKAEEDSTLKSILNEQEKYKMAAGLVEVKGSGIIITLDDPEPDEFSDGYSYLMTNYELLLNLVNKLKDAGAEAISINGQRIIATTEISLAGDNVNINTIPTAPPYQIKAIGNPDTIEATITIRYGIIENLKKSGVHVDIVKQGEINIPRYNGILKFRYAQPIVEEEKE
ncbi:DUF881 domain-containing protein [Anaerovorax sp. IOR16]|uniref:DUF881 domain-containing protein n=1 Tax=Anaerovorax sp. IOR16 TaxID=2773458 RepID=UPI0019CF9710|nr:DUF881 domain-containing protein [Anaerovorax sp. IOR16]